MQAFNRRLLTTLGVVFLNAIGIGLIAASAVTCNAQREELWQEDRSRLLGLARAVPEDQPGPLVKAYEAIPQAGDLLNPEDHMRIFRAGVRLAASATAAPEEARRWLEPLRSSPVPPDQRAGALVEAIAGVADPEKSMVLWDEVRALRALEPAEQKALDAVKKTLAGQHIAKAKKLAAQGRSDMKAAPKFGWSIAQPAFAEARDELDLAASLGAEGSELTRLRKEYEAAIEKGNCDAGRILREQMTPQLDKHFLENGMDVGIRISGECGTKITFTWSLWSRPAVYKLQDSDFVKQLHAAGFKHLVFDTGYGDSYSIDWE